MFKFKYKVNWEKFCAVCRIVGGAVMVASLVGGIIEGKDWKLAITGMAIGVVITYFASFELTTLKED